jgi:threonine synthase
VMVEEDEISSAFIKLAIKGFFVEPSSAVAYAAYEKQLKDKETFMGDKAVIVLTGNGLKSKLQPPVKKNAAF